MLIYYHWYIRENQAATAIDLLNKSFKLVEQKEQNLESEKLKELHKLDLQVLKYSLYKNLGWARFKQKRDEEAKIYLKIAVGIASNPEIAKYIRNPGAAYCLLAQVLERQQAKSKTVKPKSQSVEIHQSWQKCLKWNEERLAAGENISQYEDNWLYKAKKKLQ
ncbi:MAG: hypothetical protein QNJ70_28070 [Xenococcaceae cyanobacterium MO_207.B15]|nr:hypothetical protein [Xenococcaceae cyanobacterium MO_207.B15]